MQTDSEVEAQLPAMLIFATIWRRFFAVFIDSAIVGALAAPFFLVFLGEGWELYSKLYDSHWNVGNSFLIGGAFLIPFVVYEGMLLQVRGQTFGKIVMGIQVVRIDGKRIKSWQAWVRPLIRVLFRWFGIVNYGAALLTQEKTCVHDLLAKTRVIQCATRETGVRSVLGLSSSLSAERAQEVFWVLWILATIIGWTLGATLWELVRQAKLSASIVQGIISDALIGVGIGTAQWLVLRRQVPRAWWWISATTLAWAVSWLLVNKLESSLDSVRLSVTLGLTWSAEIAAGLALHWITGWLGDLGLHEVASKVISPAFLWSAAPSIAMALPGAVVGLLQLPVLWRFVFRAGWWVLANAVAFSAAAAVGLQSANNRSMAGALLGIALVSMQSLVLRWRILGTRWWVPVCTFAFSVAIVVFEGDLTFAILFGTITGIALVWLLQQPKKAI